MRIVHSLAWFRSDASGYESPRAGTSQGIFFPQYILVTVRAHFAAFTGWDLFVFHDKRVMELPQFAVLKRLHDECKLTLVYMGNAETLCGSMLWRMSPCFMPSEFTGGRPVDWIVCRDVDSLPMHRDRRMVEDAIGMGADAHAILDSESHSGPLMGGMTAFRCEAVRGVVSSVRDMIEKSGLSTVQHGSDQRVLNSVLWPALARKTVIHQRRRDIQYPQAMRTLAVLPQVTDLDKVIRHVGAAYSREQAMAVMDAMGVEKL